jgi:hypothetical protein
LQVSITLAPISTQSCAASVGFITKELRAQTFLMVVAVVVADAGAAAVVVAAHHRHGDRGHASN